MTGSKFKDRAIRDAFLRHTNTNGAGHGNSGGGIATKGCFVRGIASTGDAFSRLSKDLTKDPVSFSFLLSRSRFLHKKTQSQEEAGGGTTSAEHDELSRSPAACIWHWGSAFDIFVEISRGRGSQSEFMASAIRQGAIGHRHRAGQAGTSSSAAPSSCAR